MKIINILVFPCGSEIGLEVHRSLKYSRHINLIGTSSIDDHGKYAYKNYIGGLPYIDSSKIINELKEIVFKNKIDMIYPTMDKVLWKLKKHENKLGCKIISSDLKTTEICLSKSKTYNSLKGKIKTPKVYNSIKHINDYPIFLKPDIGYGSRGTYKVDSAEELENIKDKIDFKEYVITEYLPREEFTVDCFSDRNSKLLFVGPRERKRISKGISVNTQPVKSGLKIFKDFAKIINDNIELRGAWFYQVKKDAKGQLTLLEVASRLGGSSSLYRAKGINFALLSVFDMLNIDVDVITNEYEVELDRAFSNKYKTNLNYSTVYVDFDDCLIIDKKINTTLISFLYEAFNEGKKIILLSKCKNNLQSDIKKYRLNSIFDEVIHIHKDDKKYKYINYFHIFG